MDQSRYREESEDVKVYSCALSDGSCRLTPTRADDGSLLFGVSRKVKLLVMYAQSAEPVRKRRRRDVHVRWMRCSEVLRSETVAVTAEEGKEQAFTLARVEGADTLSVMCQGSTEVELVALTQERKRVRRA